MSVQPPAGERIRALPGDFLAQFFRGLEYPVRALDFVRRHRLWGLCAWPIAINIALLIVLAVLTVVYAGDVGSWIWARPEGAGFWHTVKMGLWHALRLILLLILLILDVIVFALLGTVIALPFLDTLSERTERILGTSPQERRGAAAQLHSVGFEILDALRIILFYLLVVIPLLLLNLVPVVGSILHAVLSITFAWLLLALDFLSLPMNRRLVPFRAKWRTVWRQKWISLGFGCAVFVLLLVPILNTVLIPLAAVGGTFFYLELAASGRLQS
jgi:CysZ protein